MEDILTPERIREAYLAGWFPMADEDGEIGWYQPRMRALFPIEGIRVSRSLAKTLRAEHFEIRFDTSFGQVVRGCRRPDGNWINEAIIEAYVRIHAQGWAHSAETWREGRLVGGIYGLALGGCFSAESMFHRERDASKVALWAMVEKCRALGFIMFDAQVMNAHLLSLGAFEIPAEAYMAQLGAAQAVSTAWSYSR